MNKYNPNYHFNNTIIKYIEDISKMQGELEGVLRNIRNEISFHFIANVDAVHFSTKLGCK